MPNERVVGRWAGPPERSEALFCTAQSAAARHTASRRLLRIRIHEQGLYVVVLSCSGKVNVQVLVGGDK